MTVNNYQEQNKLRICAYLFMDAAGDHFHNPPAPPRQLTKPELDLLIHYLTEVKSTILKEMTLFNEG